MTTTTAPNQFTDFVQQSQDALRTAVDSWSKTIQDVSGHLPTLAPTTDPKQIIDQVFDFSLKLLDVQREFAKNVVATTVSAGETVSQHLGDVTEKATAAARSAAAKVTGE